MPTPNARLDFRLEMGLKTLIEKAAEMRGQTVSDFAKSVLIEKAEAVIQETRMTRHTARDSHRFVELLAADTRPNAALRKAAQAYRRFTRS